MVASSPSRSRRSRTSPASSASKLGQAASSVERIAYGSTARGRVWTPYRVGSPPSHAHSGNHSIHAHPLAYTLPTTRIRARMPSQALWCKAESVPDHEDVDPARAPRHHRARPGGAAGSRGLQPARQRGDVHPQDLRGQRPVEEVRACRWPSGYARSRCPRSRSSAPQASPALMNGTWSLANGFSEVSTLSPVYVAAAVASRTICPDDTGRALEQHGRRSACSSTRSCPC